MVFFQNSILVLYCSIAMFILLIHINGSLSENSLNIHHTGLRQDFCFLDLLSQLNIYRINKHTAFRETVLMKRINFLLWAWFFKWIFFEQVKFEGSESPCESELLKQWAGISRFTFYCIYPYPDSPFIADNHHFSQNQQQRSWHCQCCAAPHSFH